MPEPHQPDSRDIDSELAMGPEREVRPSSSVFFIPCSADGAQASDVAPSVTVLATTTPGENNDNALEVNIGGGRGLVMEDLAV